MDHSEMPENLSITESIAADMANQNDSSQPQEQGIDVSQKSIQTSVFLDIFKEVQKQTAQAHEAFQKSMAEAHLAYLKNAEESFKDLAKLLEKYDRIEEEQLTAPEHAAVEQESPQHSSDIGGTSTNPSSKFEANFIPERQGAQQDSDGRHEFSIMSIPLFKDFDADNETDLTADDKRSVLSGASKTEDMAFSTEGSADEQQLKDELFKLVAEKTGYPLAMLDLSLDLEGDLGLDTKKKVELLSTKSEYFLSQWQGEERQIEDIKLLQDILDLWMAEPTQTQQPDIDALLLENEKKKPLKQDADPSKYAESTVNSASRAEGKQCIQASERIKSLIPIEGHTHERYVIGLVPSPASYEAQAGLWWPDHQYKVFVSHSGTSLSSIFCNLLRSKGIDAISGKKVPEDARAVIFLGGLRPATSPNEAMAINEECFELAQDAAAVYGGRAGAFITVQDTGGRFGFMPHDPIRCFLAGLPGLSKNLVQTQSLWAVKSIDIHQGLSSYEEIAQALFDELAFGGPQLKVGLRPGEERVCELPRLKSFNQGPSLLQADDCLLVIGSGIGPASHAISGLLTEQKIKLLLMGAKDPLPDPDWSIGLDDPQLLREAAIDDAMKKGQKLAPLEVSRLLKELLESRELRANISRWKDLGHEVHYLTGELNDLYAVSERLEEIRDDWGPIKGLIHDTKSQHDGLLPRNCLAEFHRVFTSKIKTSLTFLELTKDDPLKFIYVISSIQQGAAAFDDTMANEVLGKLVLRESRNRGTGCLVKHICWSSQEDKNNDAANNIDFHQLEAEMTVENGDDLQLELGDVKTEPEHNRQLKMLVHIDANSHPFLQSQTLGEKVIVPMVMVIEWFQSLIKPMQQHYQFYNLDKLKVHKPIVLEHFHGEGDRFVINAHLVEENDELMIYEGQVCQLQGDLLYTAMIELTKEGLEFPKTLDLSDFVKEEIDAKPNYRPNVPQGRNFEVLQAIGNVGGQGAQARIAENELEPLKGEQGIIHAAAYDGGLQLALLWSHHVLGGSSLPVEISKLRSYSHKPTKGPVRCVLKRRLVKEHEACSDMYFLDQSDRLFAKIEGISTCRQNGVYTETN